MTTNQKTPLEQALGFKCAEELYDLLDEREQIIIDLMIAGWTQIEIADILEISQSWVATIIREIRYKLANSSLIEKAEIKRSLKEGI